MGLLGWWKGRNGQRARSPLETWRTDWTAAVKADDGSRVADLRVALDALGLSDDDLEIETEMLEGLAAMSALAARLRDEDVPQVDTGHRIVGSEACHFSAPASLPDDPAQPAGRVMLTARRAIFAGGGRATSVPWQVIGAVVQTERDVLLVRHDRATAHRFRFNSFADALCNDVLSRHLVRRARQPGARL